MLPNFIGIGAPKAGTTWLFKCLAEHPQIFMAPCKETNFFDYATIDGRWGEYEAHFRGANGHSAVGEVSTRYLTSQHAAARIAALLPEARLFVTLRNPIEQIYSHYWHLTRQNFHQWDGAGTPRDFEAALERYPDRLVEPSRYAVHLKRWLDHFDRSQLFVILYEDICTRPQGVMQQLFSFIGVDPEFRAPSLHRKDSAVRQGISPRSALHARVHASLYAQINRKIYFPLKQLIGPRAAIGVKDFLRVRPVMEKVFHRQGYPPMVAATRAKLGDYLAGELTELGRLIDRDLSHWR